MGQGIGSVEVIGDPIAWLPRLATLTPLEWDVTWGLFADPSDVLAEFHLLMADVDNIPDITSAAALAIWSDAQNWRSLGTPGQVVQTLQTALVDFLNPQSYTFTELAGFTQRQAIVIIGDDQNGTASVMVLGVLTYQLDVIQRIFGSDSWTFTMDDPEFEWEGYNGTSDSSSSTSS